MFIKCIGYYLYNIVAHRQIDNMLDNLCKLKLTIKYANQSVIDQYLNAYHNPHKIQIEDNNHFLQQEEYLKRYYQLNEFSTKITLFKEYYKYHFEVPRIFLNEIQQIVQQNVDAKRELQYIHVSKKMEENHQKEVQFKNNSRTSKYSTSDFYNERILDDLSQSSLSNNLHQIFSPVREYKRMTSLHPRQSNMAEFLGNLPQQGLFLCNRKFNIKIEKQSPKHPVYQYEKFQQEKKPIKRCLQFFKNKDDMKNLQIDKIKTLIEQNTSKGAQQNPKIVRKIVISNSSTEKILEENKNKQRQKSSKMRENVSIQTENAIKMKVKELSAGPYCSFFSKNDHNRQRLIQNTNDIQYSGPRSQQDNRKINIKNYSKQKEKEVLRDNTCKKMFEKLIKTKKR